MVPPLRDGVKYIRRNVLTLGIPLVYAYRYIEEITEMDARQQRGMEIAATMHLEKQADGTWSVPSQQQNRRRYAVDATTKHCTCPDFELRQQPCKHVFAVEFVLKRETVTETTPEGAVKTTTTETAGVRVTYAQNWPAYNAAQTNEKAHFTALLHELCATVPNIEQNHGRKSGRNRLPLADMIFAAAFKVYSTASCRRFMTDLREAKDAGYIGHTPPLQQHLQLHRIGGADADHSATHHAIRPAAEGRRNRLRH